MTPHSYDQFTITTGGHDMSTILERAKDLVERARWKEEGWDRPDPPEILERWANGSGRHSIHFSEVGPDDPDAGGRGGGDFKVGINPKTKFNTPVGVYSYPLNPDTYDKWFDGSDKPPFASDRSWMYVLEPDTNVVTVDATGRAGWTDNYLRNAAFDIARNETDMVIDAIRSFIGEGDVPGDPRGVLETDFYQHALEDAKIPTPFARLWNFTRLVAEHGGNGPSTWTELLVQHANVGAVFDQGSGIIHPSEPTQAVYLEPRGYAVVDVAPNVWKWKKRKASRENTPFLLMRRAAEEYDFEDVVPKISPITFQNDMITWEQIGENLEANDWMHDILRETSPKGGGVYVKFSDITNMVTFKSGELRGMQMPPEMAERLQLSDFDLEGCDIGEDFVRKVGFNGNLNFRDCRFRSCTFTAEREAIDLIVTNVLDDTITPLDPGGPEMYREVLAGDRDFGSITGFNIVMEEVFGIRVDEEGMFDDCELELT